MDTYEQWLRQLVSDLTSFASARRPKDLHRAMEMIEFSTSMLRTLLDARTSPVETMPDVFGAQALQRLDLAELIEQPQTTIAGKASRS